MTLLATVKAFITNGSGNTILYKGLVVSIATWIIRSNQARYNKICFFSITPVVAQLKGNYIF